MNPLLPTIYTVAVLATSLCAVTSFADETEPGSSAGGNGAEPVVTTPAAKPPVRAYSRRVYKVDDIGMIIGGASEDAKAKVRRLPVQK